MIPIQTNNPTLTIQTHAKKIIDAIATQHYEAIPSLVDNMGSWTIEFLTKCIEDFKQQNGYSSIDTYDTQCTYNPTYKDGSKYQQEDIFLYNDKSQYGYEYQLTTNTTPNDLTLQLTFIILENNTLQVNFDSGITIL